MTIEAAYAILGLGADATLGDLKLAYRLAAKRHHPDATRRKDTSAFREAKDAYDVLVPILPKGPAKKRPRRKKGHIEPTIVIVPVIVPPLMTFSSKCNATGCPATLWGETPIQLKDAERLHMRDNQPQPRWFTRRHLPGVA